MRLKSLVPWHTKIIAKIILSRLPAAHAFWRRLDMFSHGAMDNPEYALQVFTTHFERTTFVRKHSGFVGLETKRAGSVAAGFASASSMSAVYSRTCQDFQVGSPFQFLG